MKNLFALLAFMCISSAPAQNLMTIGEVFNFEIGDELHYSFHSFGNAQIGNRSTIIDKWFSPNGDTVFYLTYSNSYYGEVVWAQDPYVEYTFSKDTSVSSYTNLDSSITTYDQKFDNDTLIETDDCGSELNGYSYCEGWESVCFEKKYGKGLGMVNNYHSDASTASGNLVQVDTRLVYYKKGDISCGSPITVGLSERAAETFDLRLSPNPASYELRLTCRECLDTDCSYVIYTSLGQKLSEGNLHGTETTIDINQLPAGTYVLKFQSSELSTWSRFVKR